MFGEPRSSVWCASQKDKKIYRAPKARPGKRTELLYTTFLQLPNILIQKLPVFRSLDFRRKRFVDRVKVFKRGIIDLGERDVRGDLAVAVVQCKVYRVQVFFLDDGLALRFHRLEVGGFLPDCRIHFGLSQVKFLA